MNLLHEFFNSQSDISPLEASEQERLENEFQKWYNQRFPKCTHKDGNEDTLNTVYGAYGDFDCYQCYQCHETFDSREEAGV